MRSKILTILFILVIIAFNGNQKVYADETNKSQDKKYHLNSQEVDIKTMIEKKYNVSVGKKKYETAGCSGCHDNGILGAPKPGQKELWTTRIAKGWGAIVKNVVSGFNKMPPKGGNESISDIDIENIVAYMIS